MIKLKPRRKVWPAASYAAISDPQSYFTGLGEQAAGEITRLWAQVRAQEGDPPGEDYLHRVARLNALRKRAEEIVLADLILLPPETRRLTGTRPALTGRTDGRAYSSALGGGFGGRSLVQVPRETCDAPDQ